MEGEGTPNLRKISQAFRVHVFSEQGRSGGRKELLIGNITVFQTFSTSYPPWAVKMGEVVLRSRSPLELVVSRPIFRGFYHGHLVFATRKAISSRGVAQLKGGCRPIFKTDNTHLIPTLRFNNRSVFGII